MLGRRVQMNFLSDLISARQGHAKWTALKTPAVV